MGDVLIIGGGVLGLLSARELIARGAGVTVVDAGNAVPSASWAGGGILSPLFPWRYPEPVTSLTLSARRRYLAIGAEIEEQTGIAVEVNPAGLLVDASQEEDIALEWALRHGLHCERLPADSIQPGLSFDRGLFFPEIAAIRNPRLLKGLRAFLRQKGVRFVDARVTSIERETASRAVAVCRDARMVADRVLLCAGASSAPLLDAAGISLPLFPAKGEMLLYQCPPGALKAIVLTEGGYLIPRRDGLVLAGSTLEEGRDDNRPSREALRRLGRMAAELWQPLADAQPVAQWAGVRPGCRRDTPFMGAVPGFDNLWLATGHFRNGLVSAPASAQLVAELMMRETPFVDPGPYAPEWSASA